MYTLQALLMCIDLYGKLQIMKNFILGPSPKKKNLSYAPDCRYGAHAILSPPHSSSSVSVHAQSALACEDKKYIPTLLRSFSMFTWV